MLLPTYVDNSLIHGKGLFASNFIDKGSIIGWLKGKSCQQDGDYVLWIDTETAFEVECDLKYINHSDHPNACYYDDFSVMAIQDIRVGEEITHNYDCREW
jgi:SET domain-containing protein